MENENKKGPSFGLLIWLLIAALVPRIVYLITYHRIWWDYTVYVGMGKFIFSGGAIGVWESFRPILWPIILGIFWKLHLNTYVMGKILVLLFSMGCIYLTYRIGNRFHQLIGIIAATLLSFTPVFFKFSIIPITDVIALFFSLFAVFLFLRKNYLFAGLTAGVSTLFRLPMIFVVIGFGIYILLRAVLTKSFKAHISNIFIIGIGFVIALVPYLTLTYLISGNPITALLHFSEGYTATGANDFLFYLKEIAINNPLLIFSVLGMIFYISLFKDRHEDLDLIFIVMLVLTLFFSLVGHKELRYAIVFLPYYCLFAACGILILFRGKLEKVTNKITFEHFMYLLIAVCMVLYVLVLFINLPFHSYLADYPHPSSQLEYYDYFADKPGVSVFGTNAQIVEHGDVKYTRYSYWPTNPKKGIENANADFITYDSCALSCKPTSPKDCLDKKQQFFLEVSKYDVVFNKTANGCNMLIYQVKK